jgi:hypothetical protein
MGTKVLSPLDSADEGKAFVEVSARNGGFLIVQNALFVTNADPDKSWTVPSILSSKMLGVSSCVVNCVLFPIYP